MRHNHLLFRNDAEEKIPCMKLILVLWSIATFALSQLLTHPFIPLSGDFGVTSIPKYSFGYGSLVFSDGDSRLCDPSVVQYTGYFAIAGSDKKYFFWFFESRNNPSSSPTVAWLTGGPGCSSMLALFGENGPCTVNKDGNSTTVNPYSWNTNANMFWIDQPPGTGFSEGDADSGEAEVAADMLGFLEAFFKALPQYNKNFYIFGESYAGHFIPAIASLLHRYNKKSPALVIDFKGMGIGNGLTAPSEQYKWYPLMAYNSSTAPPVVSEREFHDMQSSVDTCTRLIEACNKFEGQNPTCLAALIYCNLKLMKPYQDHGMNPYDMRLKCAKPPLCYDFKEIGEFLNRKEVQKVLGVSANWQECNFQVNMQFAFDFMRDYDQLIPELLEDGIRVLIYAGDQDFICNWIGNKKWLLNLEWAGKEKFNAQPDQVYQNAKGEDIGNIRTFGPLTFLQVFEAGHMVPMDQPEKSLHMFNEFLSSEYIQQDEKAQVMVETE